LKVPRKTHKVTKEAQIPQKEQKFEFSPKSMKELSILRKPSGSFSNPDKLFILSFF
jgi:hypothetical protein